jgi:glycosyltransferase involved in cell wall biosynthesis
VIDGYAERDLVGAPSAVMSELPRISVVVPFYNRQRYLGACVDALLAQDDVGGPVEIILVDNGSTDDSAAAIAEHPQITLMREETPGAYAARNTGIRRARAPIIVFTDADCVVDRDWLQSVCDTMRDPTVGIAIGECRYPAGASAALKLLGAYENAKADYVANHCPAAYHFAYANNMAVRASVFEECGPFREWARAADSELVHRLAAHRPDLRLVYRPSMRVTHLEFLRLRDRLQRLSLYTQTNARIETFRELGVMQRVGVLSHLLRGRDEKLS